VRYPSKQVRELVRELAPAGWRCDGVQRGGHVLMVHEPSGARMMISASPSDQRVAHRVRQTARRAIREAMGG
jgi:predicted RNA binding protein YcfA (HicA-like mRNA interferase family)